MSALGLRLFSAAVCLALGGTAGAHESEGPGPGGPASGDPLFGEYLRILEPGSDDCDGEGATQVKAFRATVRGHGGRCEVSTTSDFCGSPYQAICSAGASSTATEGRAARVAALERRFEGVAFRRIERDLALLENSINSIADINELGFPKRALGRILYNSSMNQQVSAEIRDTEFGSLLTSGETVKRHLKTAIQSLNFPWIFQRMLEAKVEYVTIMPTFTLDALRGLGTGTLNELDSSYRSSCGPTGMIENAFAQTIDSNDYVVICPGWLLAGLTSGKSPESVFRNLVMVMAHEMGHHLDPDSLGNKPYETYFGCLARNHAETCPDGDPCNNSSCLIDGRPTFRALQRIIDNNPLLRGAQRVDRHGDEIASDYWAVRVLSQHLRASPSASRLGVIREAYGGFCGTGDEGVHPSGIYRMEVLLRRDPEIHTLMGCSAPSSGGKPGCTLNGATHSNLY